MRIHVDINPIIVFIEFIFVANKAGTMTVDTALDLLQTAAAEMDEESEVCS